MSNSNRERGMPAATQPQPRKSRKMTRVTMEVLTRIDEFAHKNHIPFRMRKTKERVEIYSPILGNFSNRESEFPPHELNFIRRVKDEIISDQSYKRIKNRFRNKDIKEEKNKYLAEIGTDRIRYFHVNQHYKNGDIIKDCIEIDLKNAYWETADKMGLLSESLYREGLRVTKKSRLAAIGSLAKVEKWYVYDGKKDRLESKTRSAFTEFLWSTICYKVGKLMYKSAKACGKDFLFVWVDAMFVKKTAVPMLRKVFKEAGYQYSIEKAEFVDFQEKKIIVKGKGKWVKEGDKKIWKDTRDFSYSVGNGMDEKKVIEILNAK